jgi:hypothetical protein
MIHKRNSCSLNQTESPLSLPNMVCTPPSLVSASMLYSLLRRTSQCVPSFSLAPSHQADPCSCADRTSALLLPFPHSQLYIKRNLAATGRRHEFGSRKGHRARPRATRGREHPVRRHRQRPRSHLRRDCTRNRTASSWMACRVVSCRKLAGGTLAHSFATRQHSRAGHFRIVRRSGCGQEYDG